MKLMIDLSMQREYNSIMVWCIRLLEGFRANGYENIILVCSPFSYDILTTLFPDFQYIRWELENNKLWALKQWRNISKQYVPDMILSPDLYSWHSLLTKSSKTVVCHDLKWIRFNKSKVRIVILWVLFSIMMKRCNEVIAISDFVKKDILKWFPFISGSKIKVVYNGIVLPEHKVVKYQQDNNYLLYVSTLAKYKNILTLVEAFERIYQQIRHDLVIIGRPTPYWNKVVYPYIVAHHLENRIVLVSQRISDEQLAEYYRGASLFIHPSLHEGFGYTPIEAALYEIPVLTNKETALYETTLGLLNYYEPATDVGALANKIISILQNPPVTETLHTIAERYRNMYDITQQSAAVYRCVTFPSEIILVL